MQPGVTPRERAISRRAAGEQSRIHLDQRRCAAITSGLLPGFAMLGGGQKRRINVVVSYVEPDVELEPVGGLKLPRAGALRPPRR